MSLTVNISNNVNFVVRPASIKPISGEVTINEIVDNVEERSVIVSTDHGTFTLEDRSGDNYDISSSWTGVEIGYSLVNAITSNPLA